jgi:hypothetical protein
LIVTKTDTDAEERGSGAPPGHPLVGEREREYGQGRDLRGVYPSPQIVPDRLETV